MLTTFSVQREPVSSNLVYHLKQCSFVVFQALTAQKIILFDPTISSNVVYSEVLL